MQLAQVPEDRFIEPGVEGDWSVKDIMAHIIWHEREMIRLLESHDLTLGSAWWTLPTDERNHRIYELNRGTPLQEVLDEAPRAYQQLFGLVQSLVKEDFLDPDRFNGMPADWLPWQILAQNTYEHYEEHIPPLQAFIGAR